MVDWSAYELVVSMAAMKALTRAASRVGGWGNKGVDESADQLAAQSRFQWEDW